VVSEAGVGTTFFIYLSAIKDKMFIEEKKTTAIFKGTGRILVMDDDDTVLTTMRKTLRQLGYDVEIARDGEEALELYKKAKVFRKPFHAVMLDLTIRNGMGGRETIEKTPRNGQRCQGDSLQRLFF